MSTSSLRWGDICKKLSQIQRSYIEKWENLSKNRNNTRFLLNLGQESGKKKENLVLWTARYLPYLRFRQINTGHTRFCLSANFLFWLWLYCTEIDYSLPPIGRLARSTTLWILTDQHSYSRSILFIVQVFSLQDEFTRFAVIDVNCTNRAMKVLGMRRFGHSVLVGRFGRTYSVIERKGLEAHRVLGGSLRSSVDCSVTVCWWLASQQIAVETVPSYGWWVGRVVCI